VIEDVERTCLPVGRAKSRLAGENGRWQMVDGKWI